MLIDSVSYRPVTIQATNNIQKSYVSNMSFEGRKKSINTSLVNKKLINEGYELYRRVPITTANETFNANIYIKEDSRTKNILLHVDNHKNERIGSAICSCNTGSINVYGYLSNNEKEVETAIYINLFNYIKEHHKEIKAIEAQIPTNDEKSLNFLKSLGFQPRRYNKTHWGKYLILAKDI